MASNSQNGNITSLVQEDLVHISGPITEDAVISVLQQRSVTGENYVCISYVDYILWQFVLCDSCHGDHKCS